MSNLQINEIYKAALEFEGRYLNLYGGAGSGKSVFVAEKLLIRSLSEYNHKIALIRKVHRTIKGSQYSEIKKLIEKGGYSSKFDIKENEIICKATGSKFIMVGLDDPEKLKSIEGITAIWIEEATELTEEEFLQINLRLRGKTDYYKQIILTYNPIDINHWLNGFKFPPDKTLSIHTTFLDNAFIDEEYKEVLKGYEHQNLNMYNIYALGLWGERAEIIYQPFKLLYEYPNEFDETIYGFDFAYNKPTAFIKIGIKHIYENDKDNKPKLIRNEFYLEELIYELKMRTNDIIERLKILKISKRDYIYCDSEDPEKIDSISREGYNAHKADKSVKAGIDFCLMQTIYTKPENTFLDKEVKKYSWKKDKNGKLLDEPVKGDDHLLDAMRYGIYTHCTGKKEVRVTLI